MRKKSCIICMANYCRSPVAAAIMNSLNSTRDTGIDFYSRGINSHNLVSMDPRSISFLESMNVTFEPHYPADIRVHDCEQSTFLFTLDSTVNDNLRMLFKGYENKTFALNHCDPFLPTEDPFRFNEDKYLDIMNSIQKICSKLHDSIYNEQLNTNKNNENY